MGKVRTITTLADLEALVEELKGTAGLDEAMVKNFDMIDAMRASRVEMGYPAEASLSDAIQTLVISGAVARFENVSIGKTLLDAITRESDNIDRHEPNCTHPESCISVHALDAIITMCILTQYNHSAYSVAHWVDVSAMRAAHLTFKEKSK